MRNRILLLPLAMRSTAISTACLSMSSRITAGMFHASAFVMACCRVKCRGDNFRVGICRVVVESVGGLAM